MGDNVSDFEDPDFDDVVDDAVEITDEALADSPPSADISGEEYFFPGRTFHQFIP